MPVPFVDRLDAGEQVARLLREYAAGPAVVVGLARGGVEVALAVARSLDLPLTALVVRKIGAPLNPELAIGAVSETGVCWIDDGTRTMLSVDDDYVTAQIEQKTAEARSLRDAYDVGFPLTGIAGRPVIVVDDGIATGATAVVALRSVRDLGAREVVLATPVASPQALALLRPEADRIVSLLTPFRFGAVGQYYESFGQVGDGQVIRFLGEASGPAG